MCRGQGMRRECAKTTRVGGDEEPDQASNVQGGGGLLRPGEARVSLWRRGGGAARGAKERPGRRKKDRKGRTHEGPAYCGGVARWGEERTEEDGQEMGGKKSARSAARLGHRGGRGRSVSQGTRRWRGNEKQHARPCGGRANTETRGGRPANPAEQSAKRSERGREGERGEAQSRPARAAQGRGRPLGQPLRAPRPCLVAKKGAAKGGNRKGGNETARRAAAQQRPRGQIRRR